jgi:DNA-binding CsgD family transcriptional regulator
MVSSQVVASTRDLESMAEMVSQERQDLADVGLPFSLLADLVAQIPCEFVLFKGYDTARRRYWFDQELELGVPAIYEGGDGDGEFHEPFWTNYWDCAACSYPDRTGDLRSILTVGDFYSVRQWHSTGMYSEIMKPQGTEHQLGLTLPAPPGPDACPSRTSRLWLLRGPGLDFTERDRAVLTLLRPHLHEAYLDAERRRRPVPELTPRQWELLRLIAGGRTNIQVARELGLSAGTVRTHLENIYSRLDVSNRTAAVTRAFPQMVA